MDVYNIHVLKHKPTSCPHPVLAHVGKERQVSFNLSLHKLKHKTILYTNALIEFKKCMFIIHVLCNCLIEFITALIFSYYLVAVLYRYSLMHNAISLTCSYVHA